MNQTSTVPRSLTEILEGLHAVMGDERRAISRLDASALESITGCKRSLCDELATRMGAGSSPLSELTFAERCLLVRVRAELGANAALLAAAGDAIAAVLGIERTGGYDRSARRTTTSRPLRTVAY